MSLFRSWAHLATIALLWIWAAPAEARPAPPDSPAADSSEALVWARRAADTRRAVLSALAERTLAARGAAYREAWARFDAARPARPRRSAPGGVAIATHLFVPVAGEALVERQAALVQRRFRTVGRRGSRYFPMIERALRRRGLPAELKYVAVIESGLDPNAVSSAGAAGLWQFMPATGADFGLDSLGIRDPARATEAAVLYLDRLGRAFGGDWQLALAAYNCGPGRVQRLVAAHRARTGATPTFWDLHAVLPAETRDYVPRFIAVAQHFESGRRDA